jgi:hypothetical protein
MRVATVSRVGKPHRAAGSQVKPAFVVPLVPASERSALYRLASYGMDDYQMQPFSPARLTPHTKNLFATHARLAASGQDG